MTGEHPAVWLLVILSAHISQISAVPVFTHHCIYFKIQSAWKLGFRNKHPKKPPKHHRCSLGPHRNDSIQKCKHCWGCGSHEAFAGFHLLWSNKSIHVSCLFIDVSCTWTLKLWCISPLTTKHPLVILSVYVPERDSLWAFQMCSGVCQPLKQHLHSPLTPGCEGIGVIGVGGNCSS